ncbi:MAG: hypothetical protein ABI553_03885 [Chloroflexota bacterium]
MLVLRPLGESLARIPFFSGLDAAALEQVAAGTRTPGGGRQTPTRAGPRSAAVAVHSAAVGSAARAGLAQRFEEGRGSRQRDA